MTEYKIVGKGKGDYGEDTVTVVPIKPFWEDEFDKQFANGAYLKFDIPLGCLRQFIRSVEERTRERTLEEVESKVNPLERMSGADVIRLVQSLKSK